MSQNLPSGRIFLESNPGPAVITSVGTCLKAVPGFDVMPDQDKTKLIQRLFGALATLSADRRTGVSMDADEFIQALSFHSGRTVAEIAAERQYVDRLLDLFDDVAKGVFA